MKQLIEYKNKNRLAEIFQAIDIKFAFLKGSTEGETFEQITDPCKCRDFLGDVLWSKHTGETASIWGFRYNYKEFPYEEDALKLSLKFPNGETLLNFQKNLPILHEKEAKAGIKNVTQVFETNEKDFLIIVADQSWQKSTWRLSLYTYYLKVISYVDVTNLASPEREYSQSLTTNYEDAFLAHVLDNEEAFFHPDIERNHNNSGFLATINGCNGKEHQRIFGGK